MAAAPVTESHRGSSSSTISDTQTSHHARQFDLKIVRDAFVSCIETDDKLLLREYVRAYDELCM